MVAHTLETTMTQQRADRPLFLLGPARSGTTLLYRLLCLHPDAAWVSNYVARMPGLPLLAGLNRVAVAAPGAQRRIWFGGESSNAYVYGRRRSLTDRLFPMPVEGEPLFRRAGLSPTGLAGGVESADAGRRLRRAIGRIRSSSGAGVFVNKRIANIYRVAPLIQAFPEARFVALVRDGRAVSLSLSKVDWWPGSTVPWYGATPTEWAAQGGDPWELCARNWVEELRVMEEGLRGVPATQVHRLRYEDLVSDPAAVLDRVAGFAGLSPSAEWRTRLDAVAFPDRNEAWRTALEPSALATISHVQAATLAAYGYDR